VRALRRLPLGILAGLGVSLAPVGWTLQFWAGFSVNQARCNGPGGGAAPVDALTVAMTALGVALAVAGLACATGAYRGTREVAEDEAPPAGRIHFMGVVGIAITPLFIFIMVMSGVGTFFLDICRQA
jgi:hypothetical protein